MSRHIIYQSCNATSVRFYVFNPATCDRSQAYACVEPETIDNLSRVLPSLLSLAFCIAFFIVTGLSRWFYKRGSDKCQSFNFVWFTFDHVLSTVVLATLQVRLVACGVMFAPNESTLLAGRACVFGALVVIVGTCRRRPIGPKQQPYFTAPDVLYTC